MLLTSCDSIWEPTGGGGGGKGEVEVVEVVKKDDKEDEAEEDEDEDKVERDVICDRENRSIANIGGGLDLFKNNQ